MKSTITINIDSDLKTKFQINCLKKKSNVTDEIIKIIKKEVK